MDLPRRATAEVVGTALLLAAVVGSGIMGGRRLAGGSAGLALLANTAATGAALVLAFGPRGRGAMATWRGRSRAG